MFLTYFEAVNRFTDFMLMLLQLIIVVRIHTSWYRKARMAVVFGAVRCESKCRSRVTSSHRLSRTIRVSISKMVLSISS